MRMMLSAAFFLVLAPFAATAATCPGNAAWQYNASGNTQTMSQVDDLTGSGACENNVNLNQLGGKAVFLDPCQANAPTFTNISVAATGPTSIVPGVAAKNLYVCSIFIAPVTAAVNFTLISGTGTNCATTPVAMFGGTTAATGAVMAINEGWTLGTGLSAVMSANAANLGASICLTASAATQISGVIKTVAQ